MFLCCTRPLGLSTQITFFASVKPQYSHAPISFCFSLAARGRLGQAYSALCRQGFLPGQKGAPQEAVRTPHKQDVEELLATIDKSRTDNESSISQPPIRQLGSEACAQMIET